METKTREILFIFTITWLASLFISLFILCCIQYFIHGIDDFNIEMILVFCWNFGVLGTILIIVGISIFLRRFEIVKKN